MASFKAFQTLSLCKKGWRLQFEFLLPGNLCQSVDLFERVIIVSLSRKYCGILRNFDITWFTISPEFYLITFWAWKSLQRTLFFIFPNFFWPFRQIGDTSTKSLAEHFCRSKDERTPVIQASSKDQCSARAPSFSILFCWRFWHTTSGRKRSSEEIIKKLSKVPKSPIIWLWPLSGRG